MGYFYCIECQTIRIVQPDDVIPSHEIFDISRLGCSNNLGPQRAMLIYNQLVYLTRLRVRSNSATISMYLHENQTLYPGVNVS